MNEKIQKIKLHLKNGSVVMWMDFEVTEILSENCISLNEVWILTKNSQRYYKANLDDIILK